MKSSREKLIRRIEKSPLFWWYRPFYDSPLIMDGYRFSFAYEGIMPDLPECARAVRSSIVGTLKQLTDTEFANHPSIREDLGPITITWYVGGPGSEPPPGT